MILLQHKQLILRQRFELAELFGYETRNKYEILGSDGKVVGFVAEQNKGIFNFLFRQLVGHWRKYSLHFFTPEKNLFMIAHHPHRFFFATIEVKDAAGVLMGKIQQRFSLFTKRFDLEDEKGHVFLKVSSPFWRVWSFSFKQHGHEKAVIKKKWSGILFEALTDKDSFLVEYTDVTLIESHRKIILASALFIDMLYFEQKAE